MFVDADACIADDIDQLVLQSLLGLGAVCVCARARVCLCVCARGAGDIVLV